MHAQRLCAFLGEVGIVHHDLCAVVQKQIDHHAADVPRANQADARIVIAKGRNLRVYPALFHAVRHANRAEIALLRQQNLRKRVFRHKHAVGVRGAHHADAAL